MKKNLFYQKKFDQLVKDLNNLDRDKIHIIYFDYRICIKNVYHNYLMLTTKLLALLQGKKDIDHVAHISRFVKDGKNYLPKVFEATMEYGMLENDLFEKLKHFKGKVYVETLGAVNKEKARLFENNFKGVEYSKLNAFFSGINLEELSDQSRGGFCSWSVPQFLIDQGVDISKIENGDPLKITPSDLWEAKIAVKKLIYKA